MNQVLDQAVYRADRFYLLGLTQLDLILDPMRFSAWMPWLVGGLSQNGGESRSTVGGNHEKMGCFLLRVGASVK